MPTLLNKTIRLFLDSIGRREEYEFYLRKFAAGDQPAFALICPERFGFEDTASVFSFDLEFLLTVGLHPAILLCGDHASEMQTLLGEAEEQCAVCSLGADPASWVPTTASFLTECTANGLIGVVVAQGQPRETVLGTLVPGLSKRVHIVRERGAVHGPAGQPLHYVYLNRLAELELDGEDSAFVTVARRVLDRCPVAHVSVCTPWNLLQELFTVKGAGSVVRLGTEIHRHVGVESVDTERLLALLAESFGRQPLRHRVLDTLAEAYVDTEYRGAIVLEAHPAGMYLSKFAVGTEARGEGLANELWHAVRHVRPALFWRSRADNPINQWYERRADGSHRGEHWHVFWRGIGHDALPSLIQFCLDREPDFEPAGTAETE